MSELNVVHKWKRAPRPPAEVPASAASEFHALKQRLVNERLEAESDHEIRRWLERAADESAALAWTTAYPMLVWPELLEEASRTARLRAERQRMIRARNGRAAA